MLRTSAVVPLYFRVSRGPIGALRCSLGTVHPRGSMFIGREMQEMLCPFFHKEKVIYKINMARLPHIKTASPMHSFGEPKDKPSAERRQQTRTDWRYVPRSWRSAWKMDQLRLEWKADETRRLQRALHVLSCETRLP